MISIMVVWQCFKLLIQPKSLIAFNTDTAYAKARKITNSEKSNLASNNK